MRKRNKYLAAFLFVCLTTIVLLWMSSNSKNESGVGEAERQTAGNRKTAVSESSGEEARIRGQSKLESMKELLRRDYNTPINFWGKIIDQNEKPIPGARAEITVDGAMGKKKYVSYTDKEGLFELLGKRGARIRVKVFSEGYAPTSDSKMGSHVSARMIYYATEAMPAYAPPTKDNPQVFKLRKKNPVANLDHVQKKRVLISKTGSLKKISLETKGKTIDVEVRCWSSSPEPFNYDKYDWLAEIQITNGKLLPYNSMNSFQAPQIEAPLKGYQKICQVEMPKDTRENWLRSSPNGKREFWILFDDGTYAKARIEVNTGRKHYINTEIWYNLDGTNNFEQ